VKLGFEERHLLGALAPLFSASLPLTAARNDRDGSVVIPSFREPGCLFWLEARGFASPPRGGLLFSRTAELSSRR
jgi:hypothetical protein